MMGRAGPLARAEGGHLAGLGGQIKAGAAFISGADLPNYTGVMPPRHAVFAALAPILALAAAAGPALADDSAGASPAPGSSVQALYKAYFLGLKLGKIEFEAEFADGEYQAHSFLEAAGVAANFNDDRIRSEVHGAYDGRTVQPVQYRHRNLASSIGRVIQIDFEPDDVIPNIDPPFGSMGEPPATQEQRAGSLDLVSGIIQLGLNINADPEYPCGRDVPIFDGKQRYDLRAAYRGTDEADLDGYEGPVLECDIYQIPISGYDPEDWPDERQRNTPLRVWFADAGTGAHIPVRYKYPTRWGNLVIEADELTVTQTPSAADRAQR